MRAAKKYIVLTLLLLFYVTVVVILMRSFYIYQKAYQSLSRLVSHPSIEVYVDTVEEEE